MSIEQISKQLASMSNQLRNIRIQVILLAIKDTKIMTARIRALVNTLEFQLKQNPRRNALIDECVEELEELIVVKPEHHAIAQNTK